MRLSKEVTLFYLLISQSTSYYEVGPHLLALTFTILLIFFVLVILLPSYISFLHLLALLESQCIPQSFSVFFSFLLLQITYSCYCKNITKHHDLAPWRLETSQQTATALEISFTSLLKMERITMTEGHLFRRDCCCGCFLFS